MSRIFVLLIYFSMFSLTRRVYCISILGQEILREMNVLLSEGLAVAERTMFMLSHKALLSHTKQIFT